MLEVVVRASLRHRGAVVACTAGLALAGLVVARHLELDALPDVTGNAVIVLTTAPGFSPEEVEGLVTRPVESALGGLPGLVRQRSLSRYGISSVTALFDDDLDPYRARQLVSERLSGVASELPAGVDPPELAPLTGGLGEIFHFTLSSSQRTHAELLELATWRVGPLLRAVPGVVESNTWGGARRTVDVVADPVRLAAFGLTLGDLERALAESLENRPAGALLEGRSQVFLRAAGRPASVAEVADRVVLAPAPGGGQRALRIGELARLEEGAVPRLGSATAGGRGETVYVMVQMLRGANAREVMARVWERMPAVQAALPEDVTLEVVYDRSWLVNATLRTVGLNLLEGGLLVVAVLFLMLGSFRAGLLVASAIPLSMLGAVAGMVLFGIPGNLMSLGAIDFGLLVDGAVVMVEAIFHRAKGLAAGASLEPIVASTAERMARPVFASVSIILIVYVPILALTGVDGKMFRPMALTVVMALATAIVLVVTFVPAAASLFLRARDVPAEEPRLVRWAERAYRPVLGAAVAHPVMVALLGAALLAAGLFAFAQAGSSFVPQLDEGDLVIQVVRAPDVSLETAIADAGRMEALLLAEVPEVAQVVSRIGSPAVATDIMGLEDSDVFVKLKPRSHWRRGLDKEALVADIAELLEASEGGAEVAFTQPIQMRFNELVGGETTDVAAAFYGPELGELRRLAEEARAVLARVEGAADLRITLPPASALLEVKPRPLVAAQQGLDVRAVLDVVSALRAGIAVGHLWEGPVRVPVRLRLAAPETTYGLEDVPVPTPGGRLVPLGVLAEVLRKETPSVIRHEDAERRAVVGFNVRGRSLGEVVADAEAALAASVRVPAGYRLEWGGQYETFAEARARMLVVIPAALLAIFLILLATFRRAAPALIILVNVPFAGTGGMLALAARGLPVSISAAVGFIALSGIAVLNGVVLMNALLGLQAQGVPPEEAARQAAESRLRPVLMTALVASLGFLPMMLARGVGAEVQRPLATVVVGGLVTSTALTLLILPSVYGALAARLGASRGRARPEG